MKNPFGQDNDDMHKGAPKESFAKAKELRRNMTSAEKKLWEELKNNKFLGKG